jgi:hypothetical protein
MECHSAIKRNEVLIQATEWINLENLMQSVSQTRKAICYRTPFMWIVQNKQIQKDRCILVVANDWESGKCRVTANGYDTSFGGWWKCLGVVRSHEYTKKKSLNFFGGTWIWTQSFMLVRQVLFCLSHTSRPPNHWILYLKMSMFILCALYLN